MMKARVFGDFKLVNSKTGGIVFEFNDSEIHLTSKDMEYGKCEQCGKQFIKKHGRQRFCPSENTKRSSCEMKYQREKNIK